MLHKKENLTGIHGPTRSGSDEMPDSMGDIMSKISSYLERLTKSIQLDLNILFYLFSLVLNFK